MPKAPPPSWVHLWVTQGKTDHMATLEEPAILSQLEEKKRESSLSLTDLSILDLLSPGTTYVSVRWDSTNTKDTVEASTIRFRDLETEGRPSRRRRSAAAPPPPPVTMTKRNTRAQKKVPSVAESQSKKRKRERAQDEKTDTTIAISTNSSIITTEGRDDDGSESNIQLGASKELIVSAEEFRIEEKSGECSSIQESRQNMPQQEQNILDAFEEDFDSSDDEAIVYRMKMKKEAQEASIPPSENLAPLQPQTLPQKKSSNESSSASCRKFSRKNKKRRTFSKDSSEISYFGSDSFSAPTEASSKISGKRRQRFEYDSDDDDDKAVPDGQTNTANWMKMKRFFTNFT